jgi:hypothetical protein
MALEHYHRRTADPRWAEELEEPVSKGTAFLIIIICSLAGWGLLICIGAGLLRLIEY